MRISAPAADIVDGPLLIVAGPGSGKTRTLTLSNRLSGRRRAGRRESCLAITFTRRAAGEMRERLARLLPTSTDKVAIHTFHSLGLAILREHWSAAGLRSGLRVAGETERIALLAETLGLSAHKAERLLRADLREKRTQSWAGAEATEARSGLCPRDGVVQLDRLRRPRRACGPRADVGSAHRRAYRSRWRWISVDEFQDVDEQQYRLLTLLAPPDGNLCAIGDPNQAIYGFRGADASCFDRFGRITRRSGPCALRATIARPAPSSAPPRRSLHRDRMNRSPKSCVRCTSASPSRSRRRNARRPSRW
jgi:superfamily I DNA/RNA helicase